MCILCVVQKWSRRVATMLPWLVIPLIGLWALSQLLPPGFRFEVTSPRLACVLVLLVTLFWYEILMPQLSAWRVRRSARLRERKRFEAIEMEKLRKLATRRCRNCLTPYRDQNPGGGRFMCSYCGHISKRPVLDMPGPIMNSGIIGELVGKSGKIWNGKVWSENGWICGQNWLENGNWAGGSFVGKSSYWRKNGGGFCNAYDHCLAEQSYSGVVVSVRKLLASFFLSVRWLWRKIFRIGSTREVASSDAEHEELSKKGENGMNFNESRVEKARRKAEEKRQARLEKELLEEEERKQREEVARLVDERRRLRDEKMEAEQDHGKSKSPAADRERNGKRDAERRRRERRKEKEKGSSISNSDGEELEKRAGRENEKKREFDKRSESERRELLKTVIESIRAQRLETGHGVKAITTNNFSNGSTGARYFDRVKGSFLSSSKAFSGASFFGKGAHTSATVISKASKPNGFVDHIQSTANWREVHSTEHIAGQLNLNGDDKITDTIGQHPVGSELQPRSTPKKSWQQLFTRSSIVPSSSNANTISRPNQKPQTECQSAQLFGQPTASHPFDNPMHFGLSLPFTLAPFSDGSVNSTSVSSTAKPIFPLVREPAHEFIPEEPELFEDPCYDPDPEFLLGPVSESLDNFPLDLGTGFVTDSGLERPHTPKNVPISAEVNRPSPIESPMSRLRVAEERHATSNQFPCTPKTHDLLTSPIDESSNAHEPETWQMWGTPSLGQDGLSFVGGPTSWLLSLGQNKNQEDVAHPSAHKAMIPQFAKENGVFPGTYSPLKNCLGHCQNGGTFGPLGHGSNDSDPWLQKSVFQPLPCDRKNHFPPLNPQEDVSRKEMTNGTSSISATSHPSELSPASCWSKREWSVHGSGEGVGNPSQARPHIGGLFSTPDVQSLWSFN